MEENQSLFELEVDNPTASEMNEMARWSKLLGIIIFILAALVFAALLLSWNEIAASLQAGVADNNASMTATVLIILIGVAAVVVGTMVFFLVRAANRIRTGIRLRNQAMFNGGLADMKTYFIIYGIISVISLIGSLLSFI